VTRLDAERPPSPPTVARAAARTAAWRVVAEREVLDLWVAGRALPLLLGYSVLLGVTSYLVSANQALNFLEQREAVGLTVQVAVAVGGLLVLLAAADAISGERERGTLEALLLTPAAGRDLLIGKGIAALSLWFGAWAVAIPYLWYLGRGVGTNPVSFLAGLVVGSLLALFLTAFGLLVSLASRSNRLSLSVCLFLLLALYAPTQMPSAAQNGWFGAALLRADPFTAALQYLGKLVVDGHGAGQDAAWLIGPIALAALACGAMVAASSRLSLLVGERS